MARILAVNVVHTLLPDRLGDSDLTAIDKRPVPGRVRVHRLGLEGDRQYDTRHHGGPDKAVYAYAREDARWWEQELGRELAPGAFGENLTTEGIDVTGAVIGERWQIGNVLLQVVWPRIPCRTFAGFWDVRDLVKRFTAHGAPGAYCRVLKEGTVGAGDAIEVVERPGHGVTLGEVFRARSGERALVPRMLEAPALPAEAQDWARKVLAGG
ncbi:MAG: MOSC domain-containing protein [Actinomycetota bacterium]|nr:MOSC domain-containing protein [Actinomycetota bacterium]